LFGNAIALVNDLGSVSAITTNATKEFGEPTIAGNSGGRSVWWTFTPPNDGVLMLDTAGSAFDTLLGLYLGSTPGSLTPIAQNDDASDFAVYSGISQAVRSNEVYHITVDGYNGASGAAALNYFFVPGAVYRLTTASSVGGAIQVTSTNADGGLAVMPGNAGDFAGNSTVVLTAVPDPFYQFNTWTGSVASTVSPLSLAIQSDLNVGAEFVLSPFSDGFESSNLLHLSWSTGGNASWIIQTNVVAAGRYAARSGVIGNSQSSSLILSTNFTAGGGSFSCRVSCETNFDSLNFYMDGVLLGQWSGEIDWVDFTFDVEAGAHVLEWRYVKDASLASGLDAAFIDNVNLPIAGSSGSPPAPAHLQLTRQADGSFVLDLQGQANQSYVLQTSTDLVNWLSVSTNVAADGLVRLPVPSGTNRAQFYRARIAP
jgi:hypothetical protein